MTVKKFALKLGDVAQFINGYAFKPTDWTGKGRKIIRIQNLTKSGRTFNLTDREVPDKYVVTSGDILVSWSATLGVYTWQENEDALLNQHIFKVIPNKNKVEPDYLVYAIDNGIKSMQKYTHGSTMKHINRREFLKTKIYLPPLPEQRRIAAILDKADELRTKRGAALDKLDTLLQSIFFDMFGDPVTNPKGWRRIKFDKLLTSIDSGWSPRCEKRAAEGDEWGVLKLGAVTTCRYIESENKALPLNLQPKEQLEVKAGDLLFSRKNTAQLVAACALVMTTPAKLMLSDLIFRFRLAPNAPICPEYLWALLTDQGKRREIQSLATGAAGSMPNISKKRLREILIELPPYEMQAKFAEAFAKSEHLRQLQVHKSQKQDQLFHALQQRAFRGELTADRA